MPTLFDAYLAEKEKDQDAMINDWAVVLRKHYDAFIEKGFTPEQAMRLVERLWIQVDEKNWKNEYLKKFDKE